MKLIGIHEHFLPIQPFGLALLGLVFFQLAAAASGQTTAPVGGDDGWPWAKYGLPVTDNPACIPTRRTDWAAGYHELILKRDKHPDLDIVFLGDSITMMWRSQSGFEGGTPVWEKYYASLKAGNFGLSGDVTENVLWRITEGGALDGLQPKVVVLLIGINNLLRSKQYTPKQTAAGVTTIVRYLQAKLPETRILLLGIFPCWASPDNPIRARIATVNNTIAQLDDQQQVYYLDIGQRFTEPDGTITKTKLRDLLHLSEVGYEIWASAMHPFLLDLLRNEGKGEMWKQRVNGVPGQQE